MFQKWCTTDPRWLVTICWILWKLLPWKLKACSNKTLSSTVHSSGKGVKLGRSASDFSMLCLCQNSIPKACRGHQRVKGVGFITQNSLIINKIMHEHRVIYTWISILPLLLGYYFQEIHYQWIKNQPAQHCIRAFLLQWQYIHPL